LVRTFKLSAGPAMLPRPVLHTAQHELPGWRGRGYSMTKAGHRSAEFVAVMAETGQFPRRLLERHHG